MKSFYASVLFVLFAGALFAPPASGQVVNLAAIIDGCQATGVLSPGGIGTAAMTIDTTTNMLGWNISWSGLTGAPTVAHFHGPAGPGVNAGVQVNWGSISGLTSPSAGSTTITDPQETELLDGLWYINIHTAANPGGEIRGQVLPSPLPVIAVGASINGGQEVPPVATPASGTASMTLDTGTNGLDWNISWSGLSGAPTVAHFHGPANPGSNAGVQVNWGAISGLTSPSIGFAVIDCAQAAELADSLWYINIHTAQNPGGEIRGQVVPTGVLPVELTRFDVKTEGDDALLLWETLSETDNAGFEIHHARGGQPSGATDQTWQVVGFVEGQGTSTSEKNYAFRVSSLLPGRHAFRLKQVDFDGSFSYSSVVEIVADIPEQMILYPAYPNPFNPTTRLQFAVARAQYATAIMYDASGREVRVLFEGTPEAGSLYDVVVHGDELPSGVYLVRLQGESFSQEQSIILSK